MQLFDYVLGKDSKQSLNALIYVHKKKEKTKSPQEKFEEGIEK